jgi:hypothetical protein
MVDDLKPMRCYVSAASGKNKIADWYYELSAQERADADEFINLMRKTKDWGMPYYRSKLTGYKKLGELRWTSEQKQHRLVGYLSNGAYFALVGCTHKQRVYSPANALETANKRKSEIETGKAKTVPYDL